MAATTGPSIAAATGVIAAAAALGTLAVSLLSARLPLRRAERWVTLNSMQEPDRLLSRIVRAQADRAALRAVAHARVLNRVRVILTGVALLGLAAVAHAILKLSGRVINSVEVNGGRWKTVYYQQWQAPPPGFPDPFIITRFEEYGILALGIFLAVGSVAAYFVLVNRNFGEIVMHVDDDEKRRGFGNDNP